MMKVSNLYSVKDAAEYLCLKTITIYKYVYAGSITHYKIGNRIMFKQNHLDDFLEVRLIKAK